MWLLFQFVVYVALEKEEGLYNLNFHNCMNYGPSQTPSAIDMFLEVRGSGLAQD